MMGSCSGLMSSRKPSQEEAPPSTMPSSLRSACITITLQEMIHASNGLGQFASSCAPYLRIKRKTPDIFSSLGTCPNTKYVALSNYHTARGRKFYLYPGGPLCVGSELLLDAVQLLLQLPLGVQVYALC